MYQPVVHITADVFVLAGDFHPIPCFALERKIDGRPKGVAYAAGLPEKFACPAADCQTDIITLFAGQPIVAYPQLDLSAPLCSADICREGIIIGSRVAQ